MRNRLGGGIVEFYRQQATGEPAELSPVTGSTRSSKFYTRGPQAPGSPEREGFPRTGVEVPSPAREDSVLAQNVLAAVAQGSQIQCNYKQYPAIRAALITIAEMSSSPAEEARALLARKEVERLDLLFLNNKEPIVHANHGITKLQAP